MPDGEMRRPPQLWEQRLARQTAILNVGIASDVTSIVPPTTPPGGGGGDEPSPVLPPPGEFIKPSTPQLIGAVQGINVLWDGLNANGELWPYDTSWVDIHMSTEGTAFTVGSATLQGRLARPGGLYVGGLSAGTTYYFRLQGRDPAGNVTDPSDAASGQTGLTTSSDYGTATIGSGAVSFDARAIGGITTTVGTTAPTDPQNGDIWLDTSGGATTHKRYNGSSWVTQAWGSSSLSANCITATQMAAGAVTAGAIAAGAITAEKIQAGAVTTDKLTAGTITGFYISGGTINGGFITGGTVQSSSDSNRVVLTSGNELVFYSSSTAVASMYTDSGNLEFESANDFIFGNIGNANTNTNLIKFVDKGGASGNRLEIGSFNDFDIIYLDSNEVRMKPIYDQESANAANVRIGADAVDYRLARSTSTVRVKDSLISLGNPIEGVRAEKLADFDASVDPYDVLTVSPTEFQSLCEFDGGVRILGFIAEDVAAKFPWAAAWDDSGNPLAVEDRPIVAALLSVVKDQQAAIQDLRARIEALEA